MRKAKGVGDIFRANVDGSGLNVGNNLEGNIVQTDNTKDSIEVHR